MTTWFSRNAFPVFVVVLASAAVIGAFEILDSFTGSDPAVTEAGEEAVAMEGFASLAGLIKVTLFLGVGAAVAQPLRRRFHPATSE